MTGVKIPDGIVRSISVVQAGGGEVVVVYVDGVRKLVSDTCESTMIDLIELIEQENCNGKVIHVGRYTCEDFYENTCLDDPNIFHELVPELMQHLKLDS